MQTEFPPYLVRVAATLAGVLAVAWLYVVSLPMAFMESGYPAWVAKAQMLRECELGEIAFFGDSRLEAGVIPSALPAPSSNFGLAAGTAVETLSAVRRALTCPKLPRQAVVALTDVHFGPLDRYFWINALRYGFVSPSDLLEAERTAAALGDVSSFAAAVTPEGFSGWLRDWMYALRFPSVYFGSLVRGRLFGRYASNEDRLEEVLKSRGYWEYQRLDANDPAPPHSALAPGFVNTPLQQTLFEKALQLLNDKGVEVALLVMPSAARPGGDTADAAYMAYLQQVVRRFPNVHLVSDSVAHWPARLFVDGAHLTGPGAKRFTARLAACIVDGRVQPGCDLAWRETDSASQ